jgi:hypothetical protein
MSQYVPRWFEVSGQICGRCDECGGVYPANGLAPTHDRIVFGKFQPNKWKCESCRPKLFGRINGRQKFAEIGVQAIAEGVREPNAPKLVRTTKVKSEFEIIPQAK